MSLREEQKEKRRLDILMAGLDLFVKRGYAATKISDIAQAAKMSTGLLFHYFASKEQLYMALVQMGSEGMQAAADLPREDALAYFEQAAGMTLISIREQPWTAKIFVLMAQAQRSHATPEAIRSMAMQVDNLEQTADIIRRGQQEGTIRSGDPYALSNVFWCSLQGIAEQAASFPQMPLPEVEWLVDLVRSKGGRL